MIVADLKKSILHAAIRGELSPHISSNRYYYKDYINEFSNSGMRIKREESLNDLKFPIPENWKWVRLEELTSIYGRIGFRGYTTSDLVLPGEGAITLSPSNIIDSKMDYTSCTYVSWKKYNESPEIKINNNDIILVKTGSSYGKNAIVKNLPQESTINPQFVVLKNIICNISYLFYALNSDFSRQQYEKFVIGTSIPTFSQAKLNSLLIPLPPIEEQENIVSKIEELYSKLDEIKDLEDELMNIKCSFSTNMLKSIFNEMYSDENFDNFKENKLSDLADICTGNSISENVKKTKYTNINEGYNYIATKDLEFNHIFNYDNGIKIPFSEEGFKYADVDDILMCIEGGSAGKKIGILSEKVCFGNKLCKFSLFSNEVIPKFLYYYLQSPLFLKNFYDSMSGIIGGVSINKVKQIVIKYPSLEEQENIVNKIEMILPLLNDIKELVNE